MQTIYQKYHRKVGGDTDFMIGIKYLRYYPQVIFQLPSGLTIYKSLFRNPDGGRGIIGGPHQIFNNIGNYHQLKTNSNFFTNQYQLYKWLSNQSRCFNTWFQTKSNYRSGS